MFMRFRTDVRIREGKGGSIEGFAVGVANLKQTFRQKARRNEFVVGLTFDPVLSKPLSPRRRI
jgi:hypothetical protein